MDWGVDIVIPTDVLNKYVFYMCIPFRTINAVGRVSDIINRTPIHPI